MQYKREIGRPCGSKRGDRISDRIKTQIGLYPEHVSMIKTLEKKMGIGKSAVLRIAIEKLHDN